MGKLNVIHIISSHIATLRSIHSGKTSKIDLFVFFVIPLIIGLVLTILNVSIQNITGDLLKAIAIFSAFLFNMLAIVNGSLDSEKVKNNKIRTIYAKEIHSNLSFEILVGIFLVLLLIIQSVFENMSDTNVYVYWIKNIVEGLNFTLLGVFFLTLLMCLNRVYILIKH